MPNTRQAVYDLLSTNPNPTTYAIDQLTLNLYRDEVAKAVEQAKNELAAAEAANRRSREREFYPLLGPAPTEPRIVSATEDEVVYEAPQRPFYKVRLADLEAFCAEFKLDVKAMTEVGEGTRREHKGWVRTPTLGLANERGQTYREPTRLTPRKPKTPQKRVRAGNPTAAPMTVWTPAKETAR